MAALLPFVDEVITLTDSAATELRDRWGVDPLVLPHPHAVDFVRMRAHRPRWRHGDFTVGLHLGSLHGPYPPVRLVEALVEAVRQLPGTRLLVYLHRSVLDPGSACFAPALAKRLRWLVRSVDGTVYAHRPLAEATAVGPMFSLDVSVVPEFHGSHSCGPRPATTSEPRCYPGGCHAVGQRHCLVYRPGDVESLAASLFRGLLAAREEGTAGRADPAVGGRNGSGSPRVCAVSTTVSVAPADTAGAGTAPVPVAAVRGGRTAEAGGHTAGGVRRVPGPGPGAGSRRRSARARTPERPREEGRRGVVCRDDTTAGRRPWCAAGRSAGQEASPRRSPCPGTRPRPERRGQGPHRQVVHPAVA